MIFTSSAFGLWSRQESNLDLEFRKLLFYPLNYETKYSFQLAAYKLAAASLFRTAK